MASIFDPEAQHDQARYKIIAGLDRISQALKSMMWKLGKTLGLTPIQIHCLVFLRYHDDAKRRAGQLAKEFDVTPATVSQAISILIKKGFLERVPLAQDARIQTLKLTENGQLICTQIEHWANALLPHLEQLSPDHEKVVLSFLTNLISSLQQEGKITVARQCNTCRFFRNSDPSTNSGDFYCKLLEKEMSEIQLRIDCPEHEPAQ